MDIISTTRYDNFKGRLYTERRLIPTASYHPYSTATSTTVTSKDIPITSQDVPTWGGDVLTYVGYDSYITRDYDNNRSLFYITLIFMNHIGALTRIDEDPIIYSGTTVEPSITSVTPTLSNNSWTIVVIIDGSITRTYTVSDISKTSFPVHASATFPTPSATVIGANNQRFNLVYEDLFFDIISESEEQKTEPISGLVCYSQILVIKTNKVSPNIKIGAYVLYNEVLYIIRNVSKSKGFNKKTYQWIKTNPNQTSTITMESVQ